MSFQDLLSSTCRVIVASAFDEWGKAATFTPGSVKTCRFDPREDEIISNAKGEDERISGFVYLPDADKPGPSDQLEVDGVNYRIIKISAARGFSDAHHVKIAVRQVA